jgi:predicted dehydrogenase
MSLRVGIAGFGGAARQVLPAFKQVPGVELAAVADIRYDALALPELAQRASARHRGRHGHRRRSLRPFDSTELIEGAQTGRPDME